MTMAAETDPSPAFRTQGLSKVYPADLEVVAEFLTQDATLIQAGASATLEGWGGDEPIAALVTRVGFRLDARIIVNELPDALRLPTDALVRNGADWAVFRIERGRARLTPVRVGVGDDHYRVILGGLSGGDRVILFPGDSLADGDQVRAATQWTGAIARP